MMADRIDHLNTTLTAFVEKRLISAIAYGIYHTSESPLMGSIGVIRWGSATPVSMETLFDVASLTKILCTLPAIMQLVDTGAIDLRTSIGTYLSYLPNTIKNPTVEQLLCHRGGLPALITEEQLTQDQPLNREGILSILERCLVNPPGYSTQYSDIGYMLLGWLVEEVSRTRLDQYAKEHIFSPLGMNHTLFNPLNTENVAATRFCDMRQKILQGETQNIVSWSLGGVAGHAGLFSTVPDVLRYGITVMENPELIFSRQRLNQTLVDHGDGRGLGWMLAQTLPNVKNEWPQDSFGHTGYTGTSIVIMPSNELVLVLLSNRTHPNMVNPAIQALRQEFHDFVLMK
jgi:CubicO group peptidase (beta-lactamase class C family)